ncbi:MAG TPA: AzlD domain-containing protein [Pseudolabrys sp.]|nr:AzlD domain-containing protein [Pseudolabrys sp.]
MIEHDPIGFAAMLTAMAAAVILCRLGGFWLLGRFTIGPRLRKILNALPGAVIASTIAPILFTGGVSAWAALTAAALTMAAVRNDSAALAAGVLVAAGVRAAGL